MIAWFAPSGEIIRVSDPHLMNTHMELLESHGLFPEDALNAGWVRVRGLRGIELNLEGYPDTIFSIRDKLDAWMKGAYKQVVIDVPRTAGISGDTEINIYDMTRDEFLEEAPAPRHRRVLRRRATRQFKASLRTRVRRHLRHPSKSCLCHRSKTVNRIRLGLLKRI